MELTLSSTHFLINGKEFYVTGIKAGKETGKYYIELQEVKTNEA